VTVTAWRIVAGEYAVPPFNPFDGEGSRINGGRWNSPGSPAVYASGSVSLAVLERLVHTGDLSAMRGCFDFRVTIAEELIALVDPASLPPAWNDPQIRAPVQQIGDEWLARGETAVLRVPSAVIPMEYNYVLNPRHRDFTKLEIGLREPLPIDPRLLKS
jgi:RES domain-containing protein